MIHVIHTTSTAATATTNNYNENNELNIVVYYYITLSLFLLILIVIINNEKNKLNIVVFYNISGNKYRIKFKLHKLYNIYRGIKNTIQIGIILVENNIRNWQMYISIHLGLLTNMAF